MRPNEAARLLLLATIWGSSFLLIEVALEDLGPWAIVAGRLLFGTAALAALLIARGAAIARAGMPWRSLAVMAIVSNIVPFALITWGQLRISSGLAAILNSTTPLFTAVLAAATIAAERLGALRITGIALGFIGAAVVVGGAPGTGRIVGALAVVAASASYAVGFVYARTRLVARRRSALELSAGQLAIASCIALPLGAWETLSNPPAPELASVASVAALGSVGTGIAYFIYYGLVRDIGPTSASFVTYLLPVFGMFLGWAFLDERVGWNALVGTLLVLGGIALAEAGAPARRAQRIEAATRALE